MERKENLENVIQISTIWTPNGISIIALCKDSSIWKKTSNLSEYWFNQNIGKPLDKFDKKGEKL